jgi:transcriptional regulator with XRE-family HTH domain
MKTRSKIEIDPQGRFATALKDAVEESGMSLAELGQRVDSTYEHMRKLVAGRAFPSPNLLRSLAHELKADRQQWLEMIEADRLHKKYKTLPKQLKISPELEPFEAIIPLLSPYSRETLLAMAKTMLRQDRAVLQQAKLVGLVDSERH